MHPVIHSLYNDVLQIKLEYTAEGPFSLHGCPDNIVEQPQQQKQEQQQQAEPTEGTTTANPQHQLAVSNPICHMLHAWQKSTK